jgi:uncharacterized protein (UPF0297 family)
MLLSLFSVLYNAGMAELVKERPANPIEFLASYLLQNDPQRMPPLNVAANPSQGGR